MGIYSKTVLLALPILAAAAAWSAAPGGTPLPGVAVVELFTSQGCSSCPPADRLLSKLSGDPRYRGRVIPLSFHVDYWNYIGWQDPYSSPAWSNRQKLYAQRAFHTGRIYTPQAVINGTGECVGSNEKDLLSRVSSALATPPAAEVAVEVDPVTPEGQLRIRAKANLLRAPQGGAKADLELWIAVYESGLSTPVKAGENASLTLRNDHVVRRFEQAFRLPATAGATRSGELVLGIDRRWKKEGLGVAALLQDPATLAIYGAAGGSLPELSRRP